MTGYRIGWAIAPREIVEIMTNVQAQTTSCVSLILQAGAEGALTGVQSVVEALRLQIQNNRDILMSEIDSFTGVRCHKPDGTFYALPDFRAYSNDSVKLSEFLLKKALVVTVPGREFGMEGHLRLSYSGTVKDVTDGLARMKWALDPNSANEIYRRQEDGEGLAMTNLLEIKTPAQGQAAALKADIVKQDLLNQTP